MKEMIVGSPFEGIALTLRTILQGFVKASRKPEEFCDWYNSEIAPDVLVRLCDRDAIFVDVGAHIGSVTSLALKAGLKVVVVEAIPEKAKALRAKFSEVDLFECAVADAPGTATFFVARKSGYSGLGHVDDAVEITVPVERLDDLLKNRKIGGIKIDVEGAELRVLKGAETTIENNRPAIMFESGPEERFGITKQEIWQWFDGMRYGIFCPDRIANTGRSMTLDVFLDCHEYPRRTLNYVALPLERESELRMRVKENLR